MTFRKVEFVDCLGGSKAHDEHKDASGCDAVCVFFGSKFQWKSSKSPRLNSEDKLFDTRLSCTGSAGT